LPYSSGLVTWQATIVGHAERVRGKRALIGPAASVASTGAPRKHPHSAGNAPPAAERAASSQFIGRGIAGKHGRSVKRRADNTLGVGRVRIAKEHYTAASAFKNHAVRVSHKALSV